MNRTANIWDQLTRVVIFLLFVAGLLIVAVWYLPLIKQNERMRKEILRLDTRYDKEKEANKQLRTAIDSLQHDPRAVERLARESLGFARPGETVIQFTAPPITNRPSLR